jgi:poly-gamma-glutamate capsule biosynthesis protein CapA/YwtB (metallophosphatase superfamily)
VEQERWAQAAPENSPVVRVMFGGDVMLGRIVKEHILRDGAGYPLGAVAPLMRGADLTIVNLECAITASLERWHGEEKAFYFGAPPQAVEALTDAGVDLVSLANNHALDFGIGGMRDTLALLRRHGIGHAGAGENLAEARAATLAVRRGIRFGMAAFCDHQADFAARTDSPGIAYLDPDDESSAVAVLREALEPLSAAQVDWPILSLHWGPNMVFRPSPARRRLAHAAIDMGWKIVFGHSAHVFQGIEFHRGCPILYAAGDLVDDYRIDPDFHNDRQLLFEMTLDRERLHRIALHPVRIKDCRVEPATGEALHNIESWMRALCQEMGTTVRQDAQGLWIDAPHL